MSKSVNLNDNLVIMAGGVGSRFWPMSTTEYPKQFYRCFWDRTHLYPNDL